MHGGSGLFSSSARAFVAIIRAQPRALHGSPRGVPGGEASRKGLHMDPMTRCLTQLLWHSLRCHRARTHSWHGRLHMHIQLAVPAAAPLHSCRKQRVCCFGECTGQCTTVLLPSFVADPHDIATQEGRRCRRRARVPDRLAAPTADRTLHR
eukprot:3045257-Pyramimonas_sp.AAC.1